jgi:hypothetical protein
LHYLSYVHKNVYFLSISIIKFILYKKLCSVSFSKDDQNDKDLFQLMSGKVKWIIWNLIKKIDVLRALWFMMLFCREWQCIFFIIIIIHLFTYAYIGSFLPPAPPPPSPLFPYNVSSIEISAQQKSKKMKKILGIKTENWIILICLQESINNYYCIKILSHFYYFSEHLL